MNRLGPYSVSTRSSFPSSQSFLAVEDMGESLDEVEALIKKHENFEKSLDAQEEKFNALEEASERLMTMKHYAAKEIEKRRREVGSCIAGIFHNEYE